MPWCAATTTHRLSSATAELRPDRPPPIDPIVGLLITITIAILFVLRGAARDIYRRLMDALEPELVDKAEAALSSVNGVEAVDSLRLRWLGHRLRAETDVTVASTLNVVEGHAIAVEAQHRLLHDVPALTLPRFTSIRARPAATTPARPSRTTGDAARNTGARVS
jgi:divalent metal cation (Fe/Co/Zn/Cd) transporter